MAVDPRAHTLLLERLTEVVVLVSLFTAGLKLSPGLKDRRWLLPLRLALTSMVITVLAIAGVAWLFLDLPLGACVLLGAHPRADRSGAGLRRAGAAARATATGCASP